MTAPTMERDLTATSDLMLWAAEAEAAAGIARSVAATSFVPESLKVRQRKDGPLDLDATVAQVAAALLTGQELGLGPMASLRAIVIIPPVTGSPALLAVALRALLQQHGHEVWLVEQSDSRVIMDGLRAGSDHVQRVVWTIDRARALKIAGFDSPMGNWVRQPANMLTARCTAELARLIAADVIMGLPVIAEELLDGTSDDDGPPLAADGESATAPTAAGQARRRATRRAAPARRRGGAALALAAPAPTGPAGEAQGPSGPAAPPMIDARQRARLWAGLKGLGLTERDEALAQVSAWVGREVPSSNALTATEASTALEAIDAEGERRAAQAAQDEAGGPDDD